MFLKNHSRLLLLSLLCLTSFSALRAQTMESFSLDNSKWQVIKARRGAVLFVPPNTFEDSNGVQATRVVVRVMEIIDNSDLFENGIATQDEKNILVTGGIIYFDAFSDKGKLLRISPQSHIVVQVPSDNPVPTIKVGTGRDFGKHLLPKELGGDVDLPVPASWANIKSEVDILEPGKLIKVYSKGGIAMPDDDANSIRSGYAFKFTQCGWFMLYNLLSEVAAKETASSVNVTVNMPDAQLILIPRRYSSLITPESKGKNQYLFKSLPQGEDYILMGFWVSGNKYYYGQKLFTLQGGAKPKIDLKLQMDQVSLEYLRAALGAF